MNEVSHLRSEIGDLTNILALITKRGPDFEIDDDTQATKAPRFETSKADPEIEDENVGEAEFEAPIALGDVEAHTIKRNALDRLAEVLARFKTAKGSKMRRKHELDAKHVASVIMVEESEGKSVTFLCSKNEGLDVVDMEFLRKLESLLQSIATTGTGGGQPEQVDQVFDVIFDHLKSRIKYYSTILRNIFKDASQAVEHVRLTSQNVQEQLQQAIFRDWIDPNGLCFRFQLDRAGEEAVSDRAAECLSNQDEETLVHEVFDEIRHLFGDCTETPQVPMKNLLKQVYRIVRHPRQRPTLKSLLRQLLKSEKRFNMAWNSLLYLTRTFHAAVNLVDFVTRLNFVSIKFQQVSSPQTRRPMKPDKRTPTEVLASLGYSLPTEEWRGFFKDTKRVQEFSRLSRLRNTVHAEVQLILHVDNLIHNREDFTSKIYPYIGCSKKCCFFCDLFRIQHGTFQARGTHQTLFPLWAAPHRIPKQSIQVLRRFLESLRDILRVFLTMLRPPRRKDLIQQSSAALSTAQAVQRETPVYSTRPQTLSRMMLGPAGVNATEYRVEFMPSPETHGYAYLFGGSKKPHGRLVPIEEAETAKVNHERKIYALEKIDEMPATKPLNPKVCHRCRSPARYRCSACWTQYCSSTCQKRDWASHVFVCRVSKRPNDVDFLRLTIRTVMRNMKSGDTERIHNAMIYLLADDHICRTFGFNYCEDRLGILNLACLYSTILSNVRPVVVGLQQQLESGNLGDFMEKFCQIERKVARITNKDECACVTWFLNRYSSNPFLVPNRDATAYEIWYTAVAHTIESFGLENRFDNGLKLDQWQADIFDLYVALQPTIWHVPDIYSSSWIKFGFCYCRSFQQRSQLAWKYLELLSSNAMFDDIVSAYKTSSLEDLMRTHGIDIPELIMEGINPRRPPPSEYSVYRLMIGVEHALSGRWCPCFEFREGRRCHAYFETHLDSESDANFGFHLTSSWERWQLLNFYKYLFRLPDFDPRRMAEAKEDSDRGSLEAYLNALVPDVRMKLSDRYRTSLLFPRLGDRLGVRVDGQTTPQTHISCICKEHEVSGPPGYRWQRIPGKSEQ
ncbi:hypothetical protein K449DRAFT_375736 [Hypoxylon sp. EC38]|nr:hypothetical protein K449DRAFT_375736 [Hypoxylon sp. EC38]